MIGSRSPHVDGSRVRDPTLEQSLATWSTRFSASRHDPFNGAYGDAAVAARYIGLAKTPWRVGGEWQHGVVVKERNQNADWIIGGDGMAGGRRNQRYFVAREDQAIALKAFGFGDVHAIGLPFVYVALPNLTRIPGTLLAMPSHGLPEAGSRIVGDYADYIAAQRQNFQDVVVCLHRADFCQPNVRVLFAERGLTAVCGADPDDADGYDRMAWLFSMFDVVTGNEFGSHLAYSALTGAKVSIAGPQPAFDRCYYQKLPFYRNCSAVLDLAEQLVESRVLEFNYPFLYVDPRNAQSCTEWAAHQIGLGNRRRPEELRGLFGWTPMGLIQRRFRDCVGGTWDRARNGFGRLKSMVTG